MTDTAMIDRLKQFVKSEMRSCSMDIGGIRTLVRKVYYNLSTKIRTGQLHHYTYTGCGEEQWLSKILPLRWKR